MSEKKLKEVRLHKSGKFTTSKKAYSAHIGVIMYVNNYCYTTCYDKESEIKKAKKMLYKHELKIINKELKRLEDKKTGILKNKL